MASKISQNLSRKFSKFYREFVTKCNYVTLSDCYVPRTIEESQEILNVKPVSASGSKLLKIAILGVPNSGKSTLINQLVNWNVCSVSQKVHTTVINARAVKNIGLTQLIFLDTPGLVTKKEAEKHNLKSDLVDGPEKSLKHADYIGVLHDVSDKYTRHALHPKVLRLLALYPTIPSVLILNKVDRLAKKEMLLMITNQLTGGFINNIKIDHFDSVQNSQTILAKNIRESNTSTEKYNKEDYKLNISEESSVNDIQNQSQDIYKYDPIDTMFTPEDVYSGRIKLTENQMQYFLTNRKSWPKFEEVFMISALNGTGVDSLRSYLESRAQPDSWIFPNKVVTDQNPQIIAIGAVRAHCLECLSRNIPYELKFEILYWDLNEADVLSILIGVYCSTKSHMKLLIGQSGRKVKEIAKLAEQELRNTFRTEVKLRINFEYHSVKTKL